MKKNFTDVRHVVKFIRFCGRLTSTWPPDPSFSKLQKILHEFFWWLSFLNVVALFLPLILGIYHFRFELGILMKTISELTALTEVFFNLILCKIQRPRLQALLSELTRKVLSANIDERKIYQKYADRYSLFLMTLGISFFMTAVIFSCAPLIMDTELPADAWYPFPIRKPIVKCCLYFTQVLAILQTGMTLSVDFMVNIMLWYSSARIEILSKSMNNFTETRLAKCVLDHQRIITFATEMNYAVRFIILKGNGTMALAVICGAFPLIRHEPILVVSQFILFVGCGLLRLYVTAWPADDLADMSEKIAHSAYNIPWAEASLKVRKSVQIMIQRSQKPLVIKVTGILPALTLTFYASFVSGTLSYFVTLRTVIDQ